MNSDYISYKDTRSFSQLVNDYLISSDDLLPYISLFPKIDSFRKIIEQKSNQYIDRKKLSFIFGEQNSFLSLSDKSKQNIKSLVDKNTFTVTTGHQLCLFTGPLYFIYKIISTINLAEELKSKYPSKNFVPVFWLASEDHDLEEVNHINLFGKTIRWKTKQKGPVGSLDMTGINDVLKELKSVLGESKNAQDLIHLFSEAYLKNKTLADATRYIINDLFGQYGLLIIDGDDYRLKKIFIPVIKKDILQQGFQKAISSCSSGLVMKYKKSQAFVRSINFFRLTKNNRVRVEKVVSEKEIENNPERFSPNVLLRPLYQEMILPNLAYVGGGSELSYWMQLKTVFDEEGIPFPILVLRNSVLWIQDNQFKKIKQLDLSIYDIFLEEHDLHKKYVLNFSEHKFSLEKEVEDLKKIFRSIEYKFTDDGMNSAIRAELQKQIKALNLLEKRLLKNEKKKHKKSLQKITNLKKDLFPENGLQERYLNFIPFYLKHGSNFIKILKKELKPLKSDFLIISP